MKRTKYFQLLLIPFLFFMYQNCKETTLKEDSMHLNAEEFTFLHAENPANNQEVKMIYYGCGYNKTSSVTIENRDILVIKKFNGAMKQPCILEYDTISFGNLENGIYQVTLEIIDTNPLSLDSVFHSETKTLEVIYQRN